MSSQRERFEAKCGYYPYMLPMERWDSDGEYVNLETRRYWHLWQDACPEGFIAVPTNITAESGHKYALTGEFSESITLKCPECEDLDCIDELCFICEGEGEYEQKVPIERTTIKCIHEAIVSVSAAPKPEDV